MLIRGRAREFYRWFSGPSPAFVDMSMFAIGVVLALITVSALLWLAYSLFGLWLVLMFFGAIFSLVGVHLGRVQKYYDGGIKGWWKDRP